MANFDESCFNSDRVSITNNGATATKITKYHATIDHSVTIPIDSNKHHVLTIKCVTCSSGDDWSIGIHRADRQYPDEWFDDRYLSYADIADGNVCEGKDRTRNATTGWKAGDTLYLEYFPKIKELSLSVNDNDTASIDRLHLLCSGFTKESTSNLVAKDIIDLILSLYPIARRLSRVMKVEEHDAGYKMAICMYEEGDSAQIIDYKEEVHHE